MGRVQGSKVFTSGLSLSFPFLFVSFFSFSYFFYWTVEPDASLTCPRWPQTDSLVLSLLFSNVESAESKFSLCIAEFSPRSVSFKRGCVWSPWALGVFQTCLRWDIWDSDEFPVRKGGGKDMVWSAQLSGWLIQWKDGSVLSVANTECFYFTLKRTVGFRRCLDFFIFKFISIFLSKRATEVAQLNWAGYAESKLCLAGAVNTVNWRWAVYEMLGCLRQTGCWIIPG